MDNEVIRIFTFGRRNELVFCKHLKQIVVKENKAISYRFEKTADIFKLLTARTMIMKSCIAFF